MIKIYVIDGCGYHHEGRPTIEVYDVSSNSYRLWCEQYDDNLEIYDKYIKGKLEPIEVIQGEQMGEDMVIITI